MIDIEANTTGPSLTVYKAVNNNASDPYVFGGELVFHLLHLIKEIYILFNRIRDGYS